MVKHPLYELQTTWSLDTLCVLGVLTGNRLLILHHWQQSNATTLRIIRCH